MKAIYKNIALAALALGAVACTQDDELASFYLNDPDAVRITAQVGTGDMTGGFTRSNPLGTTDAEVEAFKDGDKISVAADGQSAVTYTFDGKSTWTPETDKYLKWQSDEMDFTAYYPVGVNDASATTFTVPKEYADLADLANADYMTYSGTQTKGTDNSINLTMQRKMVRIVIDGITFKNQFDTDKYSVTGIKVHANTKGYANGQPKEGDIVVTAITEGNAFYALLAPTTADASATFLTVTVSDGTTSQDLNVKGIPATTAGNSYTYSLTVGKDVASITGVSVNTWTSGTITGGEAEEVISFDATSMSTDNLKTALVNALAKGYTTLDITMASEATNMFSAIAEALTVDGITEGSINLTISGATSVPAYVFDSNKYGENENYAAGATLRSVTLPDATTIGEMAFGGCAMTSISAPNALTLSENCLSSCENLTDVNLPSVQRIGLQCFSGCISLKTISLPECIDLGEDTFNSCESLETVYAPKAKTLGPIVFICCESLTKVTLGSVESVNQKYDNISNGLFTEANDTKNIDLVLSSKQKVMTFDSDTKYCNATETDYNGSNDHQNKSFIGYIFKSVTLQ